MKCEICGKTGLEVSFNNSTELCDGCYHETEGDEEQMEREQREEW